MCVNKDCIETCGNLALRGRAYPELLGDACSYNNLRRICGVLAGWSEVHQKLLKLNHLLVYSQYSITPILRVPLPAKCQKDAEKLLSPPNF